MDSLPPFVVASAALAYVALWQVVGTCLLAPLLRWGGLSRGFSLVVAWLIFMPLIGCVSLALALANQATPTHFRALTTVLVVAGIMTFLRSRRRAVTLAQEAWAGVPDRGSRLMATVATAFVGIQLLFAAHPQRLYDQLNYHLVTSKRVLAFGGLSGTIYDPHLYIAGPVEYAMAWPRAIFASDLFEVAVGQSWVFAATVLPMLAAAYLLFGREGRRSSLVFAAVLAIPSLIPNNELVGMLKPGAFLLSGTFLALLAPVSSRRILAALALPFILLFTACNPTYVHVSIALFVAVVVAEKISPRSLLRASPLLWFGVAAFALSLWKSWSLTGSFLYPNDAHIFHSPMADAETFEYWRGIAFRQNDTFWQRWWGAVDVPSRNLGLSIWLVAVLGTAIYLIAARRPSWGWKGPRLPLAFALLFVSIWPLFYDSVIFSRFVAGYVAALLALGFTVIMRTEGRVRSGLVALTAALGLSVSHVEVMVRKLYDWNRTTAFAAYESQFPRIVGSVAVNEWAGIHDTVLADDNGKFFFDAAVLCGHLAPGERKVWANLLAGPQATARDIRLKAIVVKSSSRDKLVGGIPFAGPINEVWAKLAPFGREVRVGADSILKSECFFQANPCPQITYEQSSSSTLPH